MLDDLGTSKGWWGNHDFQVDGKNRVSIPKDILKDLLGMGDLTLIMTPSLHDPPHVEVWSREDWEKEAVKIKSAKPKNAQDKERQRTAIRMYVGARMECRVDKQGRVGLPTSIRNALGMREKENLHWTGLGDHAELWTLEAWEKLRAASAADAGQWVDSLGYDNDDEEA